jgi:hypothetical protein
LPFAAALPFGAALPFADDLIFGAAWPFAATFPFAAALPFAPAFAEPALGRRGGVRPQHLHRSLIFANSTSFTTEAVCTSL